MLQDSIHAEISESTKPRSSGNSNPGYTQGIWIYIFFLHVCVYLMKAEGAMILTIINHYILITRGFFHVALKDARKWTPLSFACDVQGKGQTNANKVCPFSKRTSRVNTLHCFPLGAGTIWWYWAVYIKEEDVPNYCRSLSVNTLSFRVQVKHKNIQKYLQN